MSRIAPNNETQAERILEILRRERRESRVNAPDSISRVSAAIFEAWELADTNNPGERGPKSAALRKAASVEGVIDHPVPPWHLAKMLLSMPKEDYRIPCVSHLLSMYAFFCFITPEEKDRLSQSGIEYIMPPTWNGIDRYARYAEVSICMGEEETLTREELWNRLADPPSPFYVYRLRTPSGKVFYIGKGEQFRALSHEHELFRRSYGVHTNWKKLNKIAQILHSGNNVIYEIESWHVDETQAYLREDELILMAEYDNPWILANSNGRRWAGKPNRQLCELRKSRGLATRPGGGEGGNRERWRANDGARRLRWAGGRV